MMYIPDNYFTIIDITYSQQPTVPQVTDKFEILQQRFALIFLKFFISIRNITSSTALHNDQNR